MNDPISKACGSLEGYNSAIYEAVKRIAKAYGGTMYAVDYLAFGVANRAMAITLGFREMVESQNYLCAGSLLRLQLDTALRFYALSLIDNQHQFATDILAGVSIRNMKDRKGNRMTDAYLVEELSRALPWVKSVYERTSSFIHLSDIHIFSAIESVDDQGNVHFRISPKGKEISSELYLEAINAFIECLKMIIFFLDSWAQVKDNPKLPETK
jgi:hypothetical protein